MVAAGVGRHGEFDGLPCIVDDGVQATREHGETRRQVVFAACARRGGNPSRQFVCILDTAGNASPGRPCRIS